MNVSKLIGQIALQMLNLRQARRLARAQLFSSNTRVAHTMPTPQGLWGGCGCH